MDFTSSFVLVALSMAAGTSSTLSAVNWSSIKDTKGDTTKVTPNWKGNKSELRIHYPSYFLTNPNNAIDTLWMPLTFVCDVNLTEPPSKICVCVCVCQFLRKECQVWRLVYSAISEHKNNFLLISFYSIFKGSVIICSMQSWGRKVLYVQWLLQYYQVVPIQ